MKAKQKHSQNGSVSKCRSSIEFTKNVAPHTKKMYAVCNMFTSGCTASNTLYDLAKNNWNTKLPANTSLCETFQHTVGSRHILIYIFVAIVLCVRNVNFDIQAQKKQC